MEPINDTSLLTNKISSFMNNSIPSGINDSLTESKIINNNYNSQDEISSPSQNTSNISNNNNPELDSANKNNFDFTPYNISQIKKDISTIRKSNFSKSSKDVSHFSFDMKESKSFSKLQIIQKLLKKESALKELCKNIIFNKQFSY